MNDALQDYYALIAEGDSLYRKAAAYFETCITCRAGCSDCCVNIAVFPVEWYAIELWLKGNSDFPVSPNTDNCIFLKNRECGIYAIRPFICRIHGVPLMYLTEEEDYPDGKMPDQPEYQVTWCEYNFKDIRGELGNKVISDETVIDMEELNTRLAEINYRFLETGEGSGYRLEERYTINDLYRKRLADLRG